MTDGNVRPRLGDVQGGGPADPLQLCRCHTHRKAAKGQRLYKPGNWKLTDKDLHLGGCPVLIEAAAQGFPFLGIS